MADITEGNLPNSGTFGVDYKRINEAYDTAGVASSREIAKGAEANIQNLNQEVSRYGGEGSTTGAYKGAVAGQILERDVAIANTMQKFAVEKEQTIASREQHIQQLIAEGYVDQSTGNLLRSRIDVEFQMQENQFAQQEKLLKEQQDYESAHALEQGLGTIAGIATGSYMKGLK